jgi:phage baseplate assembly protein W|tara:strand:+ start:6109 stop:6507 length:399 start_codon:yes stop_codon:yes gene_type:complete
MAQIARQETYKDLDFTFKQNPNTNDVGIKKDNASISQSVLNILRTNHGERPFNYNFGANLRSYLFENMSNITAANMSTSINTALANWEPRIEVLNTNIQAKGDENDVRITVTGRVISTNEVIDIATTIERLR